MEEDELDSRNSCNNYLYDLSLFQVFISNI